MLRAASFKSFMSLQWGSLAFLDVLSSPEDRDLPSSAPSLQENLSLFS